MTRKRWIIIILPLILMVSCAAPLAWPFQPTATPTLTNTPTLLPTATATPTPTPSPTPVPAARVGSGDQALIEGDYERAQQEFQAALDGSSDQDVKTAAIIGLAQVQINQGKDSASLTTLRTVIDQYPKSPHIAKAYFFLGQTYSALDRYTEAAQAYDNYIQANPGVIDSYIYGLKGDALYTAGDYGGAIEAYQSAINAPHLDNNFTYEVKKARAAADGGNFLAAIDQYNTIYLAAQDDYLKAQMDLLSGQSYLALGNTDSAYNYFMDAVVNYPKAYDSYSALVSLVEAGVPVSDLSRGLVDYFAGKYSLALDAFNRYVDATPGHDGTVDYYKALTLTQLKNYDEAIKVWDDLITNFPDDRFWASAWDEKSYTQWVYLEKYDDAAQTLLDFIERVPNDTNAPGYLYEAGRIYERGNNLDQAASTWESMADKYPASDLTFSAIILSGVSRYRQANYGPAQATFQRALLLATNPADQAEANFWVGKTKTALNDPAGAQMSLEQAAKLDPTGYYSERARDILLNRPIFDPPQIIDLAIDFPSERQEAETWMRATFNIPSDVSLSGLGNLASDPRIVRGKAFWELGLYENARDEFENIRLEVSTDPAGSYRLMNLFVDLGVYRSAILASRQVLDLAGMSDAATMSAPIYFNHIRFGIFYKDIVLSVAQEEGLNPLFLFSLIRQESLFEGFVSSSAGARGVMQILPDTGNEVAQNINWPPNFTPVDLYRPLVGLRLGAHYFAQQLKYFDGDYYAALAAYNSGAGNTSFWKDLSESDPDLFLEIIRFKETRTYITQISEFFSIYRRLYNRAQ